MGYRRRFNREYAYAGTVEAKRLGIRAMWGGSDPQPQQITYNAPTPPSTTQSAADWAAALPSIYQTQLQYEPQLMQQQVNMQSQLNQANAPLQAQQAAAQQQWAQQMLQQQMAGQQQYGTEMAKQQMELQKQYAPQYLQQQYEAQLQYAPQLAQSQYDISKGLYPETVGLQEQLAKQASEGMQSNVPDWMRREYISNMNAQLGSNVASPIGADYESRGLLQQKKDWGDYYRNLGLSMTGRQPLTQPQTVNNPQINQAQYNPSMYQLPQYQGTNWMSGYTPNAVMSGNNQNYGTAGSIYGNQLSYNASMYANQPSDPWMNVLGSLAGGIGGMGTMGVGKAMKWW